MTAGKIVAMAGFAVDGLIVLFRAAEAFSFKLKLPQKQTVESCFVVQFNQEVCKHRRPTPVRHSHVIKHHFEQQPKNLHSPNSADEK